MIVAGCTTLPRRASQTAPIQHQPPPGQSLAQTPEANLIDINRATQSELERLPGIGAGYAARIVEHRARHGKFRRKEQLLVVPGIGENRYREIEKFIRVSDE